jgi:hypothetical protein
MHVKLAVGICSPRNVIVDLEIVLSIRGGIARVRSPLHVRNEQVLTCTQYLGVQRPLSDARFSPIRSQCPEATAYPFMEHQPLQQFERVGRG